MNFFSRLRRLFSPSDNAPQREEHAVHEYKGYLITPAPISNGNLYRVAARISKGDLQHQLIRADELPSRQACIELSLRKARVLIDQQGDGLFDSHH